MKHLTILMLAVPVLALLASCGSTPLAVKPRLTKPSVVLLRDCLGPVALPTEGLTAGQVEGYWLGDRAALVACGAAKLAVQDYYNNRDRALSGNSGSGR